MKIIIEATPKEVAELLQAIESSKEQSVNLSFADHGSLKISQQKNGLAI